MTEASGRSSARHLNVETLDALWKSGEQIEIPVRGEPEVRLRLDPSHHELSLITPLAGKEPDVTKLKNIEFRPFVLDDTEWADVRVHVADSPHPAFAILTTIADRLQTDHESLVVALPAAVAEHRGLLAGRTGLTMEAEVGLFGELLTIEHLIGSLDPDSALAAWVGPLSEEHDIVFPDFHIEVKTTTNERRKHIIATVQQLVPLRGIPLYMLSLQLTRSMPGAGRTLRDLVVDVRSAAGDARPVVDVRLDDFQWDDQLSDVYPTAWALRSRPRVYLVDVEFPALTQSRLSAAIPHPELVSDVSYRVDVTDMNHSIAPTPLDGFVETPDGEHL